MEDKILRVCWSAFLAVVCVVFGVGTVFAKNVEIIQKPVAYNFNSINKIAVKPVTSNGVDFGKVDPERMPKIEAMLQKIKDRILKTYVEYAKLSEATIPFYAKVPDREPTTAILELNIDRFDNGNQIARKLLPFAGKAKVKIRAKLISAKDNTTLTEFSAEKKVKSGITNMAGVGAFDSDVLMSASNKANEEIFKHLSKLIGFKYKTFANFGEKAKVEVKERVNVTKEEKKEVDIIKKKVSK